MIIYCKYYKRDVLTEADCYFCKVVILYKKSKRVTECKHMKVY